MQPKSQKIKQQTLFFWLRPFSMMKDTKCFVFIFRGRIFERFLFDCQIERSSGTIRMLWFELFEFLSEKKQKQAETGSKFFWVRG